MALLQVRELRKQYGVNTAVDGVSFGVETGHCVALLGQNGAGKTTTLKMLAGLLTPSGGDIEFAGSNGRDRRQFIGYLPQYPAFYDWMTGREFVTLAARLGHMRGRQVADRVSEILRLVGLEDGQDRRIGGYSGGMKQRLGIAQALVHMPQLLILDEPVSALDPLGRREVLDLMRNLKQTTTILYSTHVLHDAQSISDDIVIMHHGKVRVAGELATVMQEHQTSVLLLEGEGSLEAWIPIFERHELVESVHCQGALMQLTLRDLPLAKQKILQEVVARHISLNRFEVMSLTLEDLFMKVVQA